MLSWRLSKQPVVTGCDFPLDNHNWEKVSECLDPPAEEGANLPAWTPSTPQVLQLESRSGSSGNRRFYAELEGGEGVIPRVLQKVRLEEVTLESTTLVPSELRTEMQIDRSPAGPTGR